MAVELVRYRDLDSPTRLVDSLIAIATHRREHLVSRHMVGFLRRYEGRPYRDTLYDLERAISADGDDENSASFAVMRRDSPGSSSNIIGSASRLRQHRLRRLRLPLAPKIADKLPVFSHEQPTGTNLSAVLATGNDSQVNAYQLLVNTLSNDEPAWTIEPERAPTLVHLGIQAAGLRRVDDGPARYDDGEVRSTVPPLAELYANDAMLTKLNHLTVKV